MLGVTCFRPLFWGPFFQFVDEIDMPIIANIMVFVPFLGDFFNPVRNMKKNKISLEFSSPFSRTFFQ